MRLKSKDLKVRKELMEEYRGLAEGLGEKMTKSSANDSFYNQNLDEKAVLLLGLGKNVRGSMQYILNELNYSPEFDGFEIYVRTDEDSEETVKAFIEENKWTRTVVCTEGWLYNKMLARAKYLITEVYFPRAWAKKDGQVYINIWHGTPLKKLGLSKNALTNHRGGVTQRNFIDADYLLYPNEHTKVNMLEAYRVSNLMGGRIVNLGYPRTGGMMQEAITMDPEIQSKLSPNGEKFYAYMPTWKDYLKQKDVEAEAKEFLDYMEENLNEDEILYVNLHHKINDSIDYSAYKRVRRFPSDVDSYKLLAHSEALVTDYSSVFYDYLAIRKHIVLYCYDYAKYKEVRGTYMELDELPFDKAMTPEEVLVALRKGKTYDDTDAFNRFCTYDSPENAKNLCSLFTKHPLIKTEKIPSSKRRQVMLYSHNMEDTREFDLLKKVANEDRDYDITFTCDKKALKKKSAYPFLWDMSVMGFDPDQQLCAVGKAMYRLYHAGKVPFEKAIDVLKYDYAVEYRRLYGRAKFDLIVLYDMPDADKLLSMAYGPAKKKIFFVNDSIFEKLKSEDTIFTDAAKYALPDMNRVYVDSQEKFEFMTELLGTKKNLKMYSGYEDLKKIFSKY